MAILFDGDRKFAFTIELTSGYCTGNKGTAIDIGKKSLEYFGNKTGHYAKVCYVKDVVKDFRADNPYKNLCFYEVKIKKNEDLPEGKN